MHPWTLLGRVYLGIRLWRFLSGTIRAMQKSCFPSNDSIRARWHVMDLFHMFREHLLGCSFGRDTLHCLQRNTEGRPQTPADSLIVLLRHGT